MGKHGRGDEKDKGPKPNFLLLATGAVLLSLVYNFIQESLFTGESRKYTGLLTVLTALTYAGCAQIERWWIGESTFRGTLTDYLMLGTLTASGMYFTNWAVGSYLSYTLRVIFKATKVLPVVIVSVIYVGKKYTTMQYINIAVLLTAVLTFAYGDSLAKTKGSDSKFDVRGIVLITLGVFADAMTANFEEKRLFKTRGASHTEVMVAASLVGAGYTFLTMLVTGEIPGAMAYLAGNVDIIPKTVFSCAAGYFSITMILQIINHYGATEAEMTKAVRRVLTIALSFAYYTKPFLMWHGVGCFLFLGFISVNVYGKYAKSRRS